MKKYIMLPILLFACLIFPVSGWATTYYADPGGSNTSPYDTWAKAATTIQGVFDNIDVDGPSTIYVHGEPASTTYYREMVTWSTADGGTSGNAVVLSTSTDEGHDGTVIISGADIISGNWAGPDGNGEYTDDSIDTEPKVVIVDDVVWTKGTVTSLGATEWAWTSADGGTLFVGADPAALVVEAGQRDNAVYLDDVLYVTIDGINLYAGNSTTTATLRVGTNNIEGIVVQNLDVKFGAGIGIWYYADTNDTGFSQHDVNVMYNAHHGIIVDSATAYTAFEIDGGEIAYNGLTALVDVVQYSGIQGTLGNGDIHRLKIHDNTATAHATKLTMNHGIYYSDGKTASCNIYENEIYNHATGSGIRLKSPAVVYNNKIYSNTECGILPGSNSANMAVVIRGNLIYLNENIGIYQAGSSGGTADLSLIGNTFYKNGSTDVYEVAIDDDLNSLDIENNIFYASDGRYTIHIPAQTGVNTIDYNLYYRSDADAGLYYDSSARTWAYWQGTLGWDVNGLNADPLFTSAGTGVFTLLPSSPCRNSGDTTIDTTRLQPTSVWPDAVLTMEDITIGAFGVYRAAVLAMLIEESMLYEELGKLI